MLMVALLAFSRDPSAFKQLAGPPSDFLTGDMKAVDPGDVGVSSRSAMIPVYMKKGPDGRMHWQGSLGVEDPSMFRMMIFSGDDQWDVQVHTPGMKRSMAAEELASETHMSEYGLGRNLIPGQLFVFTEGRSGLWNISLHADGVRAKAADNQPDGFILASGESSYRLYSHLTTHDLWVGNEIGISTFGFNKAHFGDAVPSADAGMVQEAYLRVVKPDGQSFEIPMADNGMLNDGAAGDGVFGAVFQPAEIGQYNAQVLVRGVTPEGKPFVRTSEHTFPVIAPQLTVAGDRAETRILDDNRLAVTIPIDSFNDEVVQYRAFAEVWGVGPDGSDTPIAWIGGMVLAENGEMTLNLDARWISLAKATGPFQLRNLRIEDKDTFMPVAHGQRLELDAHRLPLSAYTYNQGITEQMTQGPRPGRLDMVRDIRPQLNTGSGSRLLLVHGYCSGNVWPTSQFTGDETFSDPNQSRSHDDFAWRIRTFGCTWNSYGIVAHSQGGAASLHLYTNYWSGLDNAGSGRLIQSVGTPYQGTALAGNLALLGEIFGAGCGTNNDLTYSGASSWLAGIPTWARNAVNYYTTAFTDNWWSYDYCHIATDLFLDDPDDGTTEKSKGQLPNGVNRGHKTGWCHTNGMSHTAQYKDSGRNSTMNSNAAR